jgi:hypothetical protein
MFPALVSLSNENGRAIRRLRHESIKAGLNIDLKIYVGDSHFYTAPLE